MDKKPYWHELSAEEVKRLTDEGITWGDVLEKFKQPNWCDYPEALRGQMGCWSLTIEETRQKISNDYCKNCDCYKPKD